MCLTEKTSYYYTSHLQMPYTISHEYTLKECFEEYTSKDKLDDDNKFICSNCSGKGQLIIIVSAVQAFMKYSLLCML